MTSGLLRIGKVELRCQAGAACLISGFLDGTSFPGQCCPYPISSVLFDSVVAFSTVLQDAATQYEDAGARGVFRRP